MKHKSKIIILFVIFFGIFCFGAMLPTFIKRLPIQIKTATSKINKLCNKVSNTTSKSRESIWNKVLSGTQDDSYVAIISSYTINPVNRDSSYSIEAFGKILNNGQAVNAGQLIIGSIVINPDVNNLYRYTYSLTEGKALFGTTINAQIYDSANASQRLTTANLVVPKELYPSTMTLPKNYIDRTSNYSLNWSPDGANQYGKVQIQVSYYKGVSQYNTSGMPDSITDLVYQVADNGNFVIPQVDLARYPKGSFVGISISRAWLDNVTSDVSYVALVEAHTIPLLVTEPVNLSINGSNTICTSQNYSVTNAPECATISWSASPINTVQFSCTTCPQTTVTKISTGNITLNASITGCLTNSINKAIRVGGYGSGDYPVSGPSSTTCNSYVTYTTNQLLGATNYAWFYPNNWTYISGQGTYSLTLETNSSSMSNNNQIGVRVANACDAGGSPGIKNTYFQGCSGFAMTVSPNPTTGTVDVSTMQSADAALTATQNKIYKIMVMDQVGNIKKQFNYKGITNTTLNLSSLISGSYTIKAFNGTEWSSQQIIISR